MASCFAQTGQILARLAMFRSGTAELKLPVEIASPAPGKEHAFQLEVDYIQSGISTETVASAQCKNP